MRETSDDLLEAMTTVSRYVFSVTTRCLADLPEADVSATQYWAIAILTSRGPRTVGVLADDLGVGRPAATKLVDRLARRRLIRRRRQPTDRRQVIVEVSERGREIVRAVQHCRTRKLQQVLAALDLSAKEALARDLPALNTALSRSAIPDSPVSNAPSVAASADPADGRLAADRRPVIGRVPRSLARRYR